MNARNLQYHMLFVNVPGTRLPWLDGGGTADPDIENVSPVGRLFCCLFFIIQGNKQSSF